MYLFAATPTNQSAWASAAGQLRHTFSDENPQAWWFAWLGVLPVICLVLALAYLLNVARTRNARLALFLVSVALGGASFVLNDWGLAVFVAVPAIWGYRAIHAT
jgi:hypothetical protein